MVPDEEEHVDERDAVGRHAAHQLAVFPVLGGVGRVDELRELIVDVRQLGELPRREPVGQRIAVHRLDVGEAHRVIDLRHPVQLGHDGPFGLIVPGRHHQRHHVGRGEALLDHLLGDLLLVELGRHDGVVAVDVRALAGNDIRRGDEQHEDDRHDVARRVGKLADEGDLRHKIAVLRPVHERSGQHQQARHQHEDGKQREKDRFDQADGHIGTEPEAHEDHGDETADGGEAARADLRYALAQRPHHRLAQRQRLILLLEAVAEDDRIVERQRELEDARNGIGHEGYRPQQEVRAHVHDHGGEERHEQHGYLRVGLARERQHGDHDDRHDDHDDVDLRLDDLRKLVAERRIQIGVIFRIAVQYGVQRVEARLVLLRVVEGDVIKGRHAVVMVGRMVEGDILHAGYAPDLAGDLLRAVVRHVRDHQLRRAEGHELLVHDVQALPRLGSGGQIGRQVVFHLDPVPRNGGKDHQDADHEENEIALVDDEGGQLHHEAAVLFFLLSADRAHLPAESCSSE